MKNVLFALLLASVVACPLLAQRSGRDPLNSKEVDALREARQDPNKRLKLFVQYARGRMDGIEQLRTDPRLAIDRDSKLHDLLQDLGNIVEEMDENIEMYAKDKFDIRKPLKEIIQADSDFQQKLGTLKSAATADPKFAEELRKNFQFVLDDTTEAVSQSLQSARETLAEQETLAKDKKNNPLRKPE